MLANLAGGDAVVVLIVLAVPAIWLWGLIDAIVRPSWAFTQAGSSKALWVVLQVFLGIIAAVIYLLAIRGRVRAASLTPAMAVGGGGPGWHPDPSGRHELRYWDGQGWTPSVSDNGASSIDPV